MNKVKAFYRVSHVETRDGEDFEVFEELAGLT